MISIGQKKISNMMMGEKQVSAVYRGETLVWPSVPAGFTRLKSINSSGTQYIKTDILYRYGDTLTVSGSIDASGNHVLLGSRTSGTYKSGVQMYVNRNSSSSGTNGNIYVIGVNSTTSIYNAGYVAMNEKFSIKNVQMNFISQNEHTQPIYLFALNDKGTANVISICTFCELKISGRSWLLPCLDSSGVPCVVDVITRNAYYNCGTGSFGYETMDGAIVQPVDKYYMHWNQVFNPTYNESTCQPIENGYYRVTGGLTSSGKSSYYCADMMIQKGHKYAYHIVDEDFPYDLRTGGLRVSNCLTESTYFSLKGWQVSEAATRETGQYIVGISKGSSITLEYPFDVRIHFTDMTDMLGDGYELESGELTGVLLDYCKQHWYYTPGEWVEAPVGVITAYTEPQE